MPVSNEKRTKIINATISSKEKDIKEIISNNLSELEFKVYNLFFNNISPVKISNMLNIDIKAIYNAIYRSENKIVTKYKEMKEI